MEFTIDKELQYNKGGVAFMTAGGNKGEWKIIEAGSMYKFYL